MRGGIGLLPVLTHPYHGVRRLA